jgi:outer membrane receptor for ferric coprogen and ferric-rhodotorulic acid
LGKDDEVGGKVAFLDGRISATAAVYKMELSNQAVLVPYPALNVAGLNYYNDIGETYSKGWDGSFALAPFPGLQIVGTAYVGTVHDQNGNPISRTAENSWSVYTRYDFPKDSALSGLAVGGGAYESGGRWFSMGGMVLPGNAPLPLNSSSTSLFKLHQEVMMNLFAAYRINRHWEVRVTCENIFNNLFPMAGQGVGLIDPADPQTFAGEVTLKY